MRETTYTCDVCGSDMTNAEPGTMFENEIDLRSKHLNITIEVGGPGAREICLECGTRALSRVVRRLGLPLEDEPGSSA